MNEKLVEQVARVICGSDNYSDNWRLFVDDAQAAIAATFAFIREQAWKEEVVEAQQAVFGPDSHIRPPARLMVSLMNKAMLDQIERTQNDDRR